MSIEVPYQHFLSTNRYSRTLKKCTENLLNFSSNDYLGLSQDPLLIERAQEFTAQYGVGLSSSRSVTGNIAVYDNLESQLASVLGKPAALILASGYQTNISVLEALLDPGILGQKPLVFCDRFCHASMLGTTRYLSNLHRFQHNNLEHLKQLLEKYEDQEGPRYILAESLYSMEGDEANLPGLIQLAREHKAFLYIDDAHAVGVCGVKGWGLAADHAHAIDLIMGTFSKGLGGFGGYIGCSTIVRDYLINKCKGLIYSTALPPAILGSISAAIELVPKLTEPRAKLLKNAQNLRQFFQSHGLNTGQSTTHIIPWIIGDAKKTLYASELLEKEGIMAVTIRPPTVPVGQSRIRFCLSAAHTDQDLAHLKEALLKVDRKL